MALGCQSEGVGLSGEVMEDESALAGRSQALEAHVQKFGFAPQLR